MSTKPSGRISPANQPRIPSPSPTPTNSKLGSLFNSHTNETKASGIELVTEGFIDPELEPKHCTVVILGDHENSLFIQQFGKDDYQKGIVVKRFKDDTKLYNMAFISNRFLVTNYTNPVGSVIICDMSNNESYSKLKGLYETNKEKYPNSSIIVFGILRPGYTKTVTENQLKEFVQNNNISLVIQNQDINEALCQIVSLAVKKV